MENAENAIQAIVQGVVDGRHGPYAVATSEGIRGSITFSLEEAVWEEEMRPEKGSVVLLAELQKKRGGWRAMRARFLRPSDEDEQAN